MITSDQPMTKQHADAIIAGIDRAVISSRPEVVMAAFRALVALDGDHLEQHARQYIDIFDKADLAELQLDVGDLLYMLTVETFRGSVLPYLEKKCPDIEPSVEHDVPTWLEGNAELVASANIKIMESHLPANDPRAHRTLIEFHRSIDPAACESEQARVLLEVWAGIESRIAGIVARVAAAGTV